MLRTAIIIALGLTLAISGGAMACVDMRCAPSPGADRTTPAPAAQSPAVQSPGVESSSQRLAVSHACCPTNPDPAPANHSPTERPLKICCTGACAMILTMSRTTLGQTVARSIETPVAIPTGLHPQPPTPPPRELR